MKLFKLLFIAIIAFGMVACNNEDVPQLNGEKDASISIKVYPSTNSPGVRSAGDLSTPVAPATNAVAIAESTIHQLEVWVFNGDVLTGYGSKTFANATEVREVTNVEAIAGSSTIVVIANADIGIKASKADLLDEVKGLPPVIIDELGNPISGLVMTAEPITATLMAGNNYYGYTDAEFNAKEAVDAAKKTHLEDGGVALPLVRVNARVAIVGATLKYGDIPATQKVLFDNLRNVEVAMFNVPEKTNLFYARATPSAADLAKNEAFKYGAKWPSPDFSYVGVSDATPATTTSLFEGPLTAIALPTSPATDQALVVNTNAPYFYVNENTSTVVGEKMIIVLRAQPYLGESAVTTLKGLYTDDEGYTYYPVWVNLDGIANPSGVVGDGKVYRNTQYNVILTIYGLGRPSIDEVDKAFLDVKVEVKAWDVVNQNVVWGTPPVAP